MASLLTCGSPASPVPSRMVSQPATITWHWRAHLPCLSDAGVILRELQPIDAASLLSYLSTERYRDSSRRLQKGGATQQAVLASRSGGTRGPRRPRRTRATQTA